MRTSLAALLLVALSASGDEPFALAPPSFGAAPGHKYRRQIATNGSSYLVTWNQPYDTARGMIVDAEGVPLLERDLDLGFNYNAVASDGRNYLVASAAGGTPYEFRPRLISPSGDVYVSPDTFSGSPYDMVWTGLVYILSTSSARNALMVLSSNGRILGSAPLGALEHPPELAALGDGRVIAAWPHRGGGPSFAVFTPEDVLAQRVIVQRFEPNARSTFARITANARDVFAAVNFIDERGNISEWGLYRLDRDGTIRERSYAHFLSVDGVGSTATEHFIFARPDADTPSDFGFAELRVENITDAVITRDGGMMGVGGNGPGEVVGLARYDRHGAPMRLTTVDGEPGIARDFAIQKDAVAVDCGDHFLTVWHEEANVETVRYRRFMRDGVPLEQPRRLGERGTRQTVMSAACMSGSALIVSVDGSVVRATFVPRDRRLEPREVTFHYREAATDQPVHAIAIGGEYVLFSRYLINLYATRFRGDGTQIGEQLLLGQFPLYPYVAATNGNEILLLWSGASTLQGFLLDRSLQRIRDIDVPGEDFLFLDAIAASPSRWLIASRTYTRTDSAAMVLDSSLQRAGSIVKWTRAELDDPPRVGWNGCAFELGSIGSRITVSENGEVLRWERASDVRWDAFVPGLTIFERGGRLFGQLEPFCRR